MNAQHESTHIESAGAESADAAQDAIIEEFSFFSDWTERYQYLIDLGRKLPVLAGELKSEANKVQGCQSQVWLVASGDANKLQFLATSDSAIVSGLVALVLRVYSGRSAQEVLATQPRFIEAIGLAKHLSPTRNNGLAAMLAKIREYAGGARADDWERSPESGLGNRESGNCELGNRESGNRESGMQ